MKKRPTISLAMIVKNERHHLPKLLESVQGCFDEIHITDTGSNDGTQEFILSDEATELSHAVMHLHHFDWINDFSAARNYSFSHVKTDFVMWMDGDDVLANREAFINFRDHAMEFGDYWLAAYDYAMNADGTPAVTFARERIVKVANKPKWNYFVHEGIQPMPGWQIDYAQTWKIQHHRTIEDIQSDRSRNISIIEKNIDKLDSRMKFYYGKELFENGNHEKAISVLVDAASLKDIEIHDRILAFQYACYACTNVAEKMKPEYQAEKLTLAISLAHQGLQLEPRRAEFYCIIGDAYLRMGQLLEALPCFEAAQACVKDPANVAGAIYEFKSCSEEIPRIQKAKIYFNLGKMDLAEKEAKDCAEKFGNEEAKTILEEIAKIKPLLEIRNNQQETNEIVISCPPVNALEFDEDIYKTKPLGGSETALVQMALLLKKKTGLPVKVFNMRQSDYVGDSGVEWISNKGLNEYFSKFKPKVHIAWRHTIKLTDARTFIWAHDLKTQGAENYINFDKFMCLSQFHKDYTNAISGVPHEKIILTRNGIDPSKFDFDRPAKNPNKLLWMSSPDRGLDRAMLVCDEVKKIFPDIELHVYYGIENLYKYGPQMSALADRLKKMMKDRPYVKYHGFTEQNKMYREVADGVVWVHPCNFIETFCITAIEMLALGVYPVTRRLGALADTLAEAESSRMATLLDHDCVSEKEIKAYAKEVENALFHEKWKSVSLDLKKHSWDSVANEWVRFLEV